MKQISKKKDSLKRFLWALVYWVITIRESTIRAGKGTTRTGQDF